MSSLEFQNKHVFNHWSKNSPESSVPWDSPEWSVDLSSSAHSSGLTASGRNSMIDYPICEDEK
jgi:hypothetical protein